MRIVLGLVVKVKLKSGAVGAIEAVVFETVELVELEALDALADAAVVLGVRDALEDEVVLDAAAFCPDFGK